jgi:hypothetical protein
MEQHIYTFGKSIALRGVISKRITERAAMQSHKAGCA